MSGPVSTSTGTAVPASQVPAHIAIIMDGNNRWAREHGHSGIGGHSAGATAAREVVRACRERGVKVLTLFAFSSENWERPRREVNALMALFINVLQRDEIRQLHEHSIRVRFIGRRDRFNHRLQKLMADAEDKTAANTAMTVVVAADYGGRWDIVQATRGLAADVASGAYAAGDITEDMLAARLSLAGLPDPDLCIRTAGEQRISNFLLWQFAYTEFYFSASLWPDFDDAELDQAIASFAGRQRRYGRTTDQITGAQD